MTSLNYNIIRFLTTAAELRFKSQANVSSGRLSLQTLAVTAELLCFAGSRKVEWHCYMGVAWLSKYVKWVLRPVRCYPPVPLSYSLLTASSWIRTLWMRMRVTRCFRQVVSCWHRFSPFLYYSHSVMWRRNRDNMAAFAGWDEQQAYEELMYWDNLIRQGHRLLPHDFDRWHSLSTTCCFSCFWPVMTSVWQKLI